ncbi:formimidoylglutamase [Bacteroidales bacterium OttesenSCG-928-C03]|nr:formimidoylglutamase [Bacteroidales bacterium OttesenSCG-928-C03]MDL2325951.1 formimidoylglutamase [Bacteroidales bacterium OttesenSCG-928-A14]
MDFNMLFNPVDLSSLDINDTSAEGSGELLFNTITFFDNQEDLDISAFKIAIIGVTETRNSHRNFSASLGPDEIRRSFYKLYHWKKEISVIDLGNLKLGKTVEDTYESLSEISAYLMDSKVIPVVLGGSNDLAFACYRAYEKLSQFVNMVGIDACFDLGSEEMPLKSNAYLNKIILQQPNFLMNYANIGYQSYMNSNETIALMESLYFDTYRVGIAKSQIENTEPIVRNAHLLTIDISAIRKPDAPGNPHGSPHGFSGEDLCQMALYAGLSDSLTQIGFFEYDPTLDYHNQTSQMLSHALWYFIEGVTERVGDIAFKNKKDFIRFSVTVSAYNDEMIFLRSKKTDRFWTLVPILNSRSEGKKYYFLPCSEDDYKLACNDIIPERWWRAFQKMNR